MILRRATFLDSDLFFTLRCDPVAARMSRRRPPTLEEHRRWFEETHDHLLVAEEDMALIGTLRLGPDGLVSIIVDPKMRGQGYGPRMLEALEPFAKEAGIHTMLAEISYENVASQRCFLVAGWVPVLMERHV